MCWKARRTGKIQAYRLPGGGGGTTAGTVERSLSIEFFLFFLRIFTTHDVTH